MHAIPSYSVFEKPIEREKFLPYLFVAQSHGSNEAFEFRGFPREGLANEGRLRDHPFPSLPPRLARFDDFERLRVADRAHLRQRHLPFALKIMARQ